MILQNQSLLDISIQEYGNLEGLFDLSTANNISITDALEAGNILNVPSIESITPDIQGYYKNKQLTPATALDAIDYMLILFEAGLFETGIFD